MLEKRPRTNLQELVIGAVVALEIEEALDVTVRGMRDNPLTVAAFGDDAEQRRQRFRRFMGGAAKVLGWRPSMLVARGADGTIAGADNIMPPGEFLPSPSQQLRMLLSLLSNGPRAVGRVRWLGVWSKHDSEERHWHLGPLAVDTHLQGMGIGLKLIRVFCCADGCGGRGRLLGDRQTGQRSVLREVWLRGGRRTGGTGGAKLVHAPTGGK